VGSSFGSKTAHLGLKIHKFNAVIFFQTAQKGLMFEEPFCSILDQKEEFWDKKTLNLV
jgi:hypothetical protein